MEYESFATTGLNALPNEVLGVLFSLLDLVQALARVGGLLSS